MANSKGNPVLEAVVNNPVLNPAGWIVNKIPGVVEVLQDGASEISRNLDNGRGIFGLEERHQTHEPPAKTMVDESRAVLDANRCIDRGGDYKVTVGPGGLTQSCTLGEYERGYWAGSFQEVIERGGHNASGSPGADGAPAPPPAPPRAAPLP